MTIQEQIDARVKAADSGTLFFVNDFCEFDNAYVSKILSLMASYNILERLAKGIYYKPIVTEYGNVYPSAENNDRLIHLRHGTAYVYQTEKADKRIRKEVQKRRMTLKAK